MKTKTERSVFRMTETALAVALAVVLSYVEFLVPISTAVPGIKAGFANIAVLYILYRRGYISAILVSVVRIALVGFLFGSFVSVIYSISGALLSFAVMAPLRRVRFFSPVGVSIAGAVAHNAGQILAACVIMRTAQIAYYFPVLMITGCIAGIAVGLIASLLITRIPKI